MLHLTSIRGNKEWNNLRQVQVNNTCIGIQYCNGANISSSPIFIQAKYIFVDGCDNHFITNYLTRHIFPNPNEIYLDSHPVTSEWFKRFPNSKIYLSDRYEDFKGNNHNVTLMESNKIKSILRFLPRERLKINNYN